MSILLSTRSTLRTLTFVQIETLPTRSQDVQPLQNVLSISTAGKNRYLLHFNSLHSLTQWTAAIRLAMFEHATLQEAYTGSLIAGKGKLLNNIKTIMERTRIRNEDWTRVRFGAGTPWRRCWCVISPPDEKDVQKQQKQLKKKSAYERTAPLKGNIKFYDTKKTKKTQPIATITDAYSAYAIYPQSKPLIDQSTLVKVEGSITIHSKPETTTDGFVFVMPEVHPAVSGFEMLLRYLFPVYDVFALYGRPNRLIADTLDTRSLMFAMPQEKRYGYLEILDVAGLIHESGSQSWSERQWRLKLKELTSTRMTRMTQNGRPRSRASSYRGYRNSLPSRAGTLRYEDGASIRSTPSLHGETPPMPPPHSDSASQIDAPFTPPRPKSQHQRSFSEATPTSTPPRQRSQRYNQDQSYTPSRLSYEQSRPSFEAMAPAQPYYDQGAPPPPPHGIPIGMNARNAQLQRYAGELEASNERSSSESERRFGGVRETDPQEIRQELRPAPPPSSVAAPPAFAHEPGARPQKRPGQNAELRRANSRLSVTTLSQLAEAGKAGVGGTAAAGAAAAWRSNSQRGMNGSPEDQGQRGVNLNASQSANTNTADRSFPTEGILLAKTRPPATTQDQPYYKTKSPISSHELLQPQNSNSRAVSPLSQTSISSSPPAQPRDRAPSFSRNNMASAAGFAGSASQKSVMNEPPPVPTGPERPQTQRTNTGRSITRKPVPSRTPPPPAEAPPPTTRSSLDSLNDRYIDEEALTQVLARDRTQSITSQDQSDDRDDDISVYDNDSTISPDYASTRKSTETKRSRPSVERPRRGVLKTVGTVEPVQKEVQVGDTRYRPGAAPEPLNPDIPVVDFGPTQAYRPGSSSRPDINGTLTQPVHDRTKSSEGLTPSPRNESPSINQRSSVVYPSGHSNDSNERLPNRKLITPEPRLRTPPAGSPSGVADNDNRRSVVWQPGATIGGGSPGARQTVTPEQFVQQRAAANRIMTPVYAHGRKASGSPTPPAISRNSSGEWPIQQQKRQSSYGHDLPSRPNSRAASTLMNPSGDPTAYLSAREQEHVARATGSPLINMATNANKDSLAQSGLIGAIEAREREKKEIKQGLSGQMVQHAIAQRQQHSQGHQQRQQSFSNINPPYAMPGQYPPSPGQQPSTPTQLQQSPSWNTSQQQQYAQYQQHPAQQQRQQWTPPPTQQHWEAQQASPYQQQAQQYQQGSYQQAQQYQQGSYQQQGPYGQGQQQYYGSYFGNGPSGR